MNRKLIEDGIVLFYLQLFAEEGMSTTRIRHQPCWNIYFLIADAGANAAGVVILVKQDLGDADSLIHLCPQTLGVFQHQEIKLLPVDMISIVLFHVRRGKFIEGNCSLTLGHGWVP